MFTLVLRGLVLKSCRLGTSVVTWARLLAPVASSCAELTTDKEMGTCWEFSSRRRAVTVTDSMPPPLAANVATALSLGAGWCWQWCWQALAVALAAALAATSAWPGRRLDRLRGWRITVCRGGRDAQKGQTNPQKEPVFQIPH